MTGPIFVDANILVYSRDAADPVKQIRATGILEALWKSRQGRISQQVLQEYYTTVTRKLKPGIPKAEAREDIEALFAWRPPATATANLTKAWEIEDRFGLSWRDSLIVASAIHCGCAVLLSEDLQDGLRIDGLQIKNPFAADFDPAAI